jgi:DNA processing protein
MATSPSEYSALFWLHGISGVGSKTLGKLKTHFTSFQEVLAAAPEQLKAAGLGDKIIAAVRSAPGKGRDYYAEFEAQNIHAVLFDDPDYPPALKHIYDPPFLLYYRGDLSLSVPPACGVVGARNPSAYGRKQAKQLAGELVQRGIVIVSGMAKGIDTEAHRGALEAGGPTIAVWGSGLQHVYPRENLRLAEEIADRGLIFSEFFPGYPPEAGYFPMRNRLISGLSQGVLIVEAKAKSGALITADFALEQGREVYALPGPVNSLLSEGTNRLIQQGAKLILTSADILEDYGKALPNIREDMEDIAEPAPAVGPQQEALLNLLRNGPLHMDELFRMSALAYGELTAFLLELEFQGLISRQSGNYYSIR